ncbi:centrosomal AT-AC splicing factor isoform X4 [Cavia porcellus]|uniref:centrosomal AT-AC splicing factor isoform X4 n=1 Tax=Cavia porcellus TaxID=10141 RepID=UPI002FE03753
MAKEWLKVAGIRGPGSMAPPQRCPLCRQTFFCGRGHVYSRKHQRQLKGALERFLPQVEAARKAVRAAQVERYMPEHERCCWCLCCGREVRKHLSYGNLTVLHGALLEHLASPEHRKATNKFWWENKAEVQMKEKFLISPQDYARFKKSMVKSLDSYEEKEDEVIKEVSRRKGLWRPTPQAGPLSTLSPTDGGSDPGGGAKPAGGGPICLRGWFPSEDPEHLRQSQIQKRALQYLEAGKGQTGKAVKGLAGVWRPCGWEMGTELLCHPCGQSLICQPGSFAFQPSSLQFTAALILRPASGSRT